MNYIENPLHWRVSRSGYSIKTGWAGDKRIIAECPGGARATPEQITEWIANAERICELHNATVPKGEPSMTTPTPRTYTQADMDRVLADLNEAIRFQITMKVQHERDLAAREEENAKLRKHAEAQDHQIECLLASEIGRKWNWPGTGHETAMKNLREVHDAYRADFPKEEPR